MSLPTLPVYVVSKLNVEPWGYGAAVGFSGGSSRLARAGLITSVAIIPTAAGSRLRVRCVRSLLCLFSVRNHHSLTRLSIQLRSPTVSSRKHLPVAMERQAPFLSRDVTTRRHLTEYSVNVTSKRRISVRP